MRKLLFALVVVAMGGFAIAGGTPANAMTAGAVTGMSDIVKDNSSVDQVRCWWRYGHRHCTGWWRYHHRHHRHCWWRHGHRHCRWW
jgi:hypothetical protein